MHNKLTSLALKKDDNIPLVYLDEYRDLILGWAQMCILPAHVYKLMCSPCFFPWADNVPYAVRDNLTQPSLFIIKDLEEEHSKLFNNHFEQGTHYANDNHNYLSFIMRGEHESAITRREPPEVRDHKDERAISACITQDNVRIAQLLLKYHACKIIELKPKTNSKACIIQ
jgi:hypothetical protein